MWCTRWFLPLLLLPLPTAPPYFLLLFLFSLTMHAKPCFYCIVLLTTLFISSCYWQPFPIDSPLTVPWSDNITTFAEALNASIVDYSRPFPSVMRAVDRCWCDFSAGGLFEPFNVSHWEYLSVQRLHHEMERPKLLDDALPQDNADIKSHLKDSNSTIVGASNTTTSTSRFWSRILPLYSKAFRSMEPALAKEEPTNVQGNFNVTKPTILSTSAPLIRQEYDMRSYGLGIIIDFRWSR
ncbi:hypothetical protein M413DRAFT_216273 [Hebeloma cylindrosporum]|uniref:Uncharacterized protein n=1 Tax=Hebeloma cylindrosporum TaxID=76867 RepID=A0A0C3CVS0_HEBCY|nr:hypothetical protein M413DRAFT_216273 [Hebeloma cylindrosporum h7]